MIVVIDNYDSFTYNLVQYLGELGAEVNIFRNDTTTTEALCSLKPSHVVISPGPGNPAQSGISVEVIQQLGSSIPVLGVCLGHQCIGDAFGGIVGKAAKLMHGKTSLVYHQGDDLFQGIPNPFEATRYHSLIVEEPVPEVLEITAFTEVREVMGLKHKSYPIYGVQFHPESILTLEGKNILKNFLEID